MIWDVQNVWPSGTQFTLNFYCHWATLVVRNMEYGSGHFLHRKEGITKGYPLSMIAYGIGVLPLIRELWDAPTCITQPWYLDDVWAEGYFGHIMENFRTGTRPRSEERRVPV